MHFVQILIFCEMHVLTPSLSLRICTHSLTKAYADARDKVRFLEKLQPLFEELRTCADPAHVIRTILPALGSGFLQPIAGTYAKSGYLGILLAKVCLFTTPGEPTMWTLPVMATL